jgi:hypothetical protein
MSAFDLLLAQLTDPFRIALLIGLTVTSANALPLFGSRLASLALGAVFVAILIPVSLGGGSTGLPLSVGVGVVANALILAVIEAVRRLFASRST